jgi:hypothetical protein
VNHRIDPLHGIRQRGGLADVAGVKLDALLRESFGRRRGSVNHTHGVAPLLQRSDKMLS